MEQRLKKSITAGGRHTRASEDHSRLPAEESFASTQDIDQMWSDEWTQSALPKVPDIPGFHLCWLSTTNSYDTIDKRIRLGYTPVLADELPGFENYRVKAGEHVGHISCNEMLLLLGTKELTVTAGLHTRLQASLLGQPVCSYGTTGDAPPPIAWACE